MLQAAAMEPALGSLTSSTSPQFAIANLGSILQQEKAELLRVRMLSGDQQKNQKGWSAGADGLAAFGCRMERCQCLLAHMQAPTAPYELLASDTLDTTYAFRLDKTP